jgi:hypothetical protein
MYRNVPAVKRRMYGTLFSPLCQPTNTPKKAVSPVFFITINIIIVKFITFITRN